MGLHEDGPRIGMGTLMTIFPVVLSGGVGSRLWPASRESNPKQLHAMVSPRTMVQETVLRSRTAMLSSGGAGQSGTNAAQPIADPIVVCNVRHTGAIEQQLADIGVTPHAIIAEPVGRNTAPAAALAAVVAAQEDPEAILILLPADHHITNTEAFGTAMSRAVSLAQQGLVVTYGIVPDSPETGYGYIRRGEPMTDVPDSYSVSSFVEKPDRETAESYVASGDYYWNGGIFTVGCSTLEGEMDRFCPDILAHARKAVAKADRKGRVILPDSDVFGACPSDSMDYAVMERTERAAVVAADMGWSDVGSWSALHDVSERDEHGNVLTGDVVAIDSGNCLVRSQDRLVAVAGVENLIVVETPDAILVTTRDKAQKVKDIVNTLKKTGRSEL